MSFVIAAPDPMLAAAGGLIEIGSAISTANATAAAPTTSLLAAAGDEVSAAIATLFNTYAEEYQQFSTQASAFHDHFVRTLQAGMSSYASAETTNAAQQLLNVFNAPARALLGRPLIGRGTDGWPAPAKPVKPAACCSATAATAPPARPDKPAAPAATPDSSAAAGSAEPAASEHAAETAAPGAGCWATAAPAEPAGSALPAATAATPTSSATAEPADEAAPAWPAPTA
ncbi:hypothetical protein NIIDMKKI_66500 [Mycobacterium kansasii]|uniref:PE domain-containing protein n=1 Tax=Mycobacterium kansasii TaxID=1768 RepID=A0A7G1IM35_MYCKA|nr:hypothetical protein NIIDMKKI_66500 [Mycobacterium kansasii]